ncbi:unnamed protein product [Amaranthus hypochondriacus]
MGKWNRRNYARPRRRYYQDYQWSPPRDEPCPDPETEVWQDNVPMWEKKFCYLVGRIPWKKVLATKNFMNCHSNVLNWDDSAGKEAFVISKKRFWEEFNGLPSDTQLPNPDMYIDEIDWNPCIDPELARECDKEFFNPDDKYLLPSSRCKATCGSPDDDPWENGNEQSCLTEKNKGTGWGQWDKPANESSRVSKDEDPWETNKISEYGAAKNNNTGWNKWDDSVDNDPWENHQKQNIVAVNDSSWRGEWNVSWDAKEGSGWKDRRASSSAWNQETRDAPCTSYWHENHRNKSSYWQENHRNRSSYWHDNHRNKPQEFGSHRGSKMTNGRGNQSGQKPRDKYNWGPKDSINIHRGQGQFSTGCRKRDGPDYYVANNKGPRLYENGQPSYHWNRGNN